MSLSKVMRKHLVLVEITVHHHKGLTDKAAVWAAQQLVKEGMKAGSFRGSLAGQATVKATVKSYKRHMSYLKSQQDKQDVDGDGDGDGDGGGNGTEEQVCDSPR